MGIPLEILSLLISIFLNNNIDYEENSAESRDRQELYFKVARYVTMNFIYNHWNLTKTLLIIQLECGNKS